MSHGQPTADIFTDCHSHLPAITTSYTIDGTAAQKVGPDGNLSFTNLTAGKHEIAQADGVPLDFAHLRVFCSDKTANGGITELAVKVQKFSVSAVAGDEIICDVYTIPENASGLTPTATTGGTTLPNTGVGTGGGSKTPLTFDIVALLLVGFSLVVARRIGVRRG